jgi:hypothetical protein
LRFWLPTSWLILPILEPPMPSKTFNYFIVYSQKASVNRANIFHTKLDVYPLLQIVVTHFSTKSIPQPCTTSSATCERTTHFARGPCKHKLEHFQTCLGAWVCLTQRTNNRL